MKNDRKVGDYMRDIDKIIMERRPIFCKSCSGKLYYQNGGVYVCEDCSQEEMDDFGKIKKYLDEYGPSPAMLISEDTGVSMEVIDVFLKNGRLEIPEGSKFFIKCEKCGCALRFGRFCYDCTKELVGQLNVLMFEQMGEQPKSGVHVKEKGKMRYIDGKEK